MKNVLEFKRPRRKKITRRFPKIVAVAVIISFAGGAGGYYALENAPAAPEIAGSVQIVANGIIRSATSYGRCSDGVRIACVVDGDTLYVAGQKIRIADIDTPEIGQPKCSSEKALGERATDRLVELVNDGPFAMQAWQGRDKDNYGRKLRVLTRDGQSLGDVLVSEGLARTWSGRREPWC